MSANERDGYALIAFATAWGAQHGGINAFNVDLLEAIATGFSMRMRIVCVVLHAPDEAIKEARARGIELVSLGLAGERRFPPVAESAAWSALAPLRVDERTVWLGHDRITGAVALEARDKRGGCCALIHHMSYEKYEAFAEGVSHLAEEKRTDQARLFGAADHIFGVGPLLSEALADLTDRADVRELVPGLAEITLRNRSPNAFRAFLSGRLSEDTRRVKQAHLGLAGFARAVAKCDANSAYPDSLKGANEPAMRLRGVDFEHGAGPDLREDPRAVEAEIHAFVETHAQRRLGLILLPFTEDRSRLFDELRASSVALMPSWHEGFGLVAWEAIAAGVPLILSRKSGVHRLLATMDLASLVQSIDPRGATSDPYFREEDVEQVAEAIIQVAKNPQEWRRRAGILLETLRQSFSWAQCAQEFVKGLGWALTLPTRPPAPSLPTAAPGTTPENADDVLDLPAPRWRLEQGLALSQLLKAEERTVPFHASRLPFLGEQSDWISGDSGLPLSVRLLVGAGGTGKTRLALELCQRFRETQWQAGFLPSSAQSAKTAEELVARDRPALVVVDYAETRQDQVLDLLIHLQKRLRAKSGPVSAIRVLLLARAGGEWWAQLPSTSAACESLLLGPATSGPYEVPPLHEADEDRQTAFAQALRSFGQRLRLEVPEVAPDLSAEHFAHPLHLQMAALLALHGEAPKTANELVRALVFHERRYWKQAVAGAAPLIQEDPAALMALSTLSGGVASRRDLEGPWRELGLDKGQLNRLWAALQPLYPGSQGLDGLRPDLMGEVFVAQTLLDAGLPPHVDVIVGSRNASWRLNALTVLARILRTRDDVASYVEGVLLRHFQLCAAELCQVAIATPSPLTELAISAFDQLPQAKRAQVAGLLRPWLKHEVLPLTGLAVAFERFESERAQAKCAKRPTVENLLSHAASLDALSVAHSRNGSREEAIRCSCEAVDAVRLVKPENGLPVRGARASILQNHATILKASGRNNEALSASTESLQALREVTAADARFKPNLAVCLNNHSKLLSETGFAEEGYEMSLEALNLRRKLSEGGTQESVGSYANSLHNHSVHCIHVGRLDEATALSRESVERYRRLAEERPERFEADLATSFTTYANRLSDDAQLAEALELSEEALALRRKQAVRLPERFEHPLAVILMNYANLLNACGRYDQSFEVSEEALALCRKLARQLPDRFDFELAVTLVNHASRLAERGHVKSAIEMSAQSVALCRSLVERFPAYPKDDLATSLRNHANRSAELGDYDGAAASTQESLAIVRELAQRLPGKFQTVLAHTLLDCAIRASELGQMADALRSSQEAVQTLRNFSGFQPKTHGELLRYATDYVELVGWLSDAPDSHAHIGIAIDEMRIPQKRKILIQFRQAAHRLIFEASSLASDRRQLANHYLLEWNKLDSVQQRSCESLMLLLAILSDAYELPGPDPQWKSRWDDYCRQRGGRVPAWLALSVARLGLRLPSIQAGNSATAP